jgi:hypothetical protein
MICIYVQNGVPAKLGQKRIKFFMTYYQKEEDFKGHDNVYFKFKELFEIPIRTLDITLDVKRVLASKLNDLYPELKADPERMRLREKSAEKLL